MSKLGTVNGVAVISAARVPWKVEDDEIIKATCDARGLVLFDGGGKSDAICIGDIAIIWERQGERFRAFPLPERLSAAARQRVPGAWSVAVPSSEVGSMVRIDMRDGYTPDHPEGAGIEIVACGAVRYRAPMSMRELRRLLGVVQCWPGMVLK